MTKHVEMTPRGMHTHSPLAARLTDEVLINDWHAVAYSKDVAEGQLLPIQLLGEELVAWRYEGKIHVWKDLCIHRGAQLSKGAIIDGTVQCPYHGWRFNSEARCVLIPAQPDTPPPLKARAFPHRAEERYGFVWASLGDPSHDIPPFPESNDPEFRIIYAGPWTYRANAFRSMENFMDATHFPFVHADLNGSSAKPDKIEDYTVIKSPGGLVTSGINVFQPSGDHREVPVNAQYHYHCLRPATAKISKLVTITDPTKAHLGNPGDRWCVFFAAQPLDEINTIIRTAVAFNYAKDVEEQHLVNRQNKVFEQDRLIVETQHPERIPLDLKEELHIRSDKLAVAYRSWLKELGVTYGTYGD